MRNAPAERNRGRGTHFGSWHTLLLLVVTLVIAGCRSDDDPEISKDHDNGNGNATDVQLAALNQLPPLPKSPYLNTRDATYVGSSTCIECHQGEHAGFLHTGMGRSMASVVPDNEPPDVVYDHQPSGRRYQVVRKGGQLVHRELAITADGEPEQLYIEHVVPYVIGSGRHTKTYVIEVDGFFFESPITWYSKVAAWEMSPGYDKPNQLGFQREIGHECLVCHAGKTRALEGTVHRMELNELSISCERCHGPGSRHVDRWSDTTPAESLGDGEVDYSIVNPADLDRELSDSVCAQCHLGSPAVVLSRGRSFDDYRPGLPLDAFRNGYRLEIPSDEMTVVGHIDQLRLSGCYQKTAMSCVSCHDPHNFPSQETEVEYYKAICLQCHDRQACQVDPGVLAKQRADNYCVHCHMPRADTELPHMTFHHHRIGIHNSVPGSTTHGSEPGKLVPLFTGFEHSEIDQKRNLGIAYISLSQREESVEFAVHYVDQGVAMLRECWQTGLRDVELAKNLAEVSHTTGVGEAETFARYVLDQESATGKQRVSALLVMTNHYLKKREFGEAVALMRQVTRLRRNADDWQNLGQYEQLLGNNDRAAKALSMALEIDPSRVYLKQILEAQPR